MKILNKSFNRINVTDRITHSLFRKLLKLIRFSPIEPIQYSISNDTIILTITNFILFFFFFFFF